MTDYEYRRRLDEIVETTADYPFLNFTDEPRHQHHYMEYRVVELPRGPDEWIKRYGQLIPMAKLYLFDCCCGERFSTHFLPGAIERAFRTKAKEVVGGLPNG